MKNEEPRIPINRNTGKNEGLGMDLMSVRNDVGLIRKERPVINRGNWLERISVWKARHGWRTKLITGAVVGHHKARVCPLIVSVRHAL